MVNIDSKGRIPIYSGNQRTGYRSACRAYKDITGEAIRWLELQGKLTADRVLVHRLIVAAHGGPQAASGGPAVAEWVESFLSLKRDEGSAEATLAVYEQAGRVLVAAFPDRPLASLTRSDGNALCRRLVEQDKALKSVMRSRRSGGVWSDSYIKTLLCRCRTIMMGAVDCGLIDASPLHGTVAALNSLVGRSARA